jgi:hypothetical protein
MEKNFKHLFFKWVNEAIEIIQNNAWQNRQPMK